VRISDLERLPADIGSFYREQLLRLRESSSPERYTLAVQLLEVIHAAREPLGVAGLAQCLQQQELPRHQLPPIRMQEALAALTGTLVVVSDDQREVRVFHKSVSDFLAGLQVHTSRSPPP
jgi:hypothetical protein